MIDITGAYKKARRAPACLALSCLAFLTSCSLLDEVETVAPFGPTPVELQPKIVLQSLPTKGIEVAGWTRDDDYIITAVGPTRSIAIWEVATGNIIDRIRIPAEAGRTGALLRLDAINVSEDGKTAVITGQSARYIADGEYTDPRAMRYEMDLTKRTVTIAASEPDPDLDLEDENIEDADDALEAMFENDDEIYDTPEEALADLPTLPNSHDGTWALERLAVPSEGEVDDIPEGGLVLTNLRDGTQRQLSHKPMQKYDAATLSPTGRWIAMTNDKMMEDTETGLEQSVIEIYDIQTATFEPQVLIVGDYSQIQWLSDDSFAVTETSVRNDVMRDGEADDGMAPDGVIVKAQGGVVEERVEPRCFMMAVADGGFVGAGLQTCRAFPQGTYGLEKYNTDTGRWSKFGPAEFAETPNIDLIKVSDDGAFVALATAELDREDNLVITGHVLDSVTGNLLASKVFEGLTVNDTMAFSPDGKDLFVSGDGEIFRWQIGADEWGPMSISSLDTTLLSRHGDILAVAGEADDAVGLFNFATGDMLPALQFGNISSGGFFPDKPLFWAFSAEEGLRLWDTRDWSTVLTTYFFDQQGNLAVTPDGRYDSNVHPYDARFRWLVPDQPFVSLNPDAFSRDYYTPGLTERWIACRVEQTCETAFAPIKPLASLNREMPKVEIIDVAPGKTPDQALVTLEISPPEAANDNDADAPWAFDPRVFRNHQLVFRQQAEDMAQGDDLVEWRWTNKLVSQGRGQTGAVQLTSVVSLGTGDEEIDQAPLFTAYVFNEDRIKSETAFFEYERPAVAPRVRKAFVVTFGIDHYREARLNLNFAGNDATLMADSLRQIPGYEMRTLSVRSAGAAPNPEGAAAEPDLPDLTDQPEFISPDIIADVLTILAEPNADKARTRLSAAGIDASALEQATPDDLVIISYAGHGWSDNRGEFHLVTSNVAWSLEDTAPAPDGLISSVQLANWMGDIDAGTMALVIDACHSAASVENGTFKPGPLGDPGLGQLAFDKGVLILTATQADDVAVEDASLKHGLLTYVLAAEGFKTDGGRADLDRDGRITLTEWLSFAVERLPALQNDTRIEGLTTRSMIFHDKPDGQIEKRIQEPSLFDFNVFPRDIALRQVAR